MRNPFVGSPFILALALMPCFTTPSHGQGDQGLTPRAQAGGNASVNAAAASIVVKNKGHRLEIRDAAPPFAKRSTVTLDSDIQDAEIVGGNVFVMTQGCFYAFDATDPSAPVEQLKYQLSSTGLKKFRVLEGGTRADNPAVIAILSQNLLAFYTASLALHQMQETVHLSINPDPPDFDLLPGGSGRQVLVSHGNTISRADATDPANPVLIPEFVEPGPDFTLGDSMAVARVQTDLQVEVRVAAAYAQGQLAGIQLLAKAIDEATFGVAGLEEAARTPADVTFLPPPPNRAASLPLAFSVGASGSHPSVVNIVETIDPTAPAEISAIPIPSGSAGALNAFGSLLQVSVSEFGPRYYDISSPASPELVAEFPGYSVTDSLRIGNVVFAACGQAGLRVFNDDGTADWPEVGSLPAVSPKQLMQADATTILAVGGSFLNIIDVTTPTSPVLLGSRQNNFCEGLALLGSDRAVVVGAKFEIIDYSNRASPVALSSVDISSFLSTVAVSGTHAYLPEGGDTVIIVDISSHANPVVSGEFHVPQAGFGSFTVDAAASGNLLGVAAGFGGTSFWDITDPVAPTLRSQVPDISNFVMIDEDRAYVGGAALTVLDVSNPASPVALARLRGGEGGSSCHPRIFGADVYYAADAAGLLVASRAITPADPSSILSVLTHGSAPRHDDANVDAVVDAADLIRASAMR